MSHRHAVSRKARPATQRQSTGSGHRPLALVLALASGFGMVPALAQPTGAQAVVGSATLSQQGSKLLVTTTNGAGQSHSTINWQSFNVPAGSTTWFAQPNAASTSINRVLGSDPSAIFGTLGSNGRLVLVNPAGITVGAGAVVDTAGFIASTLRMSDADALAGRLRFGDGAAAGLLKVDGDILARSGDVVLIGRDVEVGAPAVVRSPQGATVLAAGRQAEVTGRGLEGIVFTLQAPTDSAVNLGNLSGDAVGVFAGTLRHSGLAQASAVSTEGGRVVLRASDAALVSGTAQAQGAGGAGGSVDVLGQKVGLLAGAVLDTSNTAGGGQIRVGGGYQGQDSSVTNAQVTYVDAGAALRADATVAGDGGRIVVWSDDTTRAHGSFSVRGGAQGGNGGLVETSGKRFLDVEGVRVAAGAPQGRMGTWLLDPDDVVITTPSSTTAPSEAYKGSTPAPTSDPATAIFNPATNGQPSVIYDSTLNTALNAVDGAYVRVLAGTTSAYSSSGGSGSGAIRLVGDVTLGRTAAGGASLELSAVDRIVFSGGTTTFEAGGRSPGRLDVILNATNGVTTESGATVRLQTLDSNASSRVSATVFNGKTWTNNGVLDLQGNSQLLLNDGTNRATFDNRGSLTGTLGTNGGVGGRTDSTGVVTRGHVINRGTVSLDGNGQFGAHSLTQVAPTSTGAPVPTFSMAGGQMTVDEEFIRDAGGFSFDGSKLSLVRSTGDLDLGSGSTVRASDNMELISYLGRVLADRSLAATSAAGGGGKVVVSAQTGVSISGQIDASGSGSSGSAGGSVSVLSQSGAITVAGIRATGGAGSLSAGAGGVVSIDTAAASVAVDSIDVSGGARANGNAAAAGRVTIAGTSVQLGDVVLTGGSGSASTSAGVAGGGAGGTLDVKASGDLRVTGVIQAAGGGAQGLGRAGDGGVVTLKSTGGVVSVNGVNLAGGSVGTGGLGQAGAAGSLTITNLAQRGTPDPSGAPVAGDVSVGTVRADGGSGGGGGAGGTVTVQATGSVSLGSTAQVNDLNLSGGNAWGSGAAGTGGRLSITSAGDAALTRALLNGGRHVAGSGGQGGAVSIDAQSVHVVGIQADGGDGGGVASAVGGKGGSLSIKARDGLMIDSGLQAHGGATSGTAQAGAGGDVTLLATGGAINAGSIGAAGGSASSTGTGGAGGTVVVTNTAVASAPGTSGGSSAGDVLLGSLNARGGSGRVGGNGGSVTVRATGALTTGMYTGGYGVDLSGGTGFGAGARGGAGGSLDLQSTGDLVAQGVSWLRGGDGGASSSGSGGAGGTITLRSLGGRVTVNELDAGGGAGWRDGAAGGTGGRIDVRAATGMLLNGSIRADGGAGQSGGDASGLVGGAGGAGGSVTLTLDSGDLSLDGLFGSGLSASGGAGGQGVTAEDGSAGGNGGAGGRGGAVRLVATAGGLTGCLLACEGGPIAAAGGAGGDASAFAGTRGGAGGKGGSVTLRASADSALDASLQASGGAGGVGATSPALNGAGGDGGSIDIGLSGPSARLVLSGEMLAGGGSPAAPTGTFVVSAPGGLLVPAGTLNKQLATAALTTSSPFLLVDAQWRNTGQVRLGAGSMLVASQLRNAGTITLEASSRLALGDESGAGQLVNESTGTLQGSGSIYGSVENAGVISPGTPESPIGQLTYSGNLVLLSTSRILADVVPSTIAVGGSTYDQLTVGGRVTLGGTLKVSTISTPAPTSAPSQTDLPKANVTAAVNTGLVLIDAGSIAAGTTFAAVDAPAELAAQLQIAAGGVPIAVPIATTAPVPTPAPAATPAPASTGALVETIVSLLRGNAPADVVQQALTEQETVVTQFLSVLVKEQKRQEQSGNPAIVQTATGCVPG